MPECHAAAHARCFLCDTDFQPVYERFKIHQELDLIAGKSHGHIYRTGDFRTDVASLVFAYKGTVQVVRDASFRIVKFFEGGDASLFFPAEGIMHNFERYHPPFSDGGWSGFSSYYFDTFQENTKDCGQCTPGKSLLFAHADCWLVTENHGINTTQLYQFGAQIQPVLPWIGGTPHTRLRGVLERADSLNCDTSLGKFLVEISRRLPPELQEHIIEYIQQSAEGKLRDLFKVSPTRQAVVEAGDVLFTQLATVEFQTVPVLRSMPRETPNLDIRLRRSRALFWGLALLGDDPVKTLCAHVKNLYGRTYLSEICFDQTGNSILSIPISPHQIRGLRFALGRFGIRAIRILYDGECKSPWLGDPSGCWFGNLAGNEIRDLHAIANVRFPLLLYKYFTLEPLGAL